MKRSILLVSLLFCLLLTACGSSPLPASHTVADSNPTDSSSSSGSSGSSTPTFASEPTVLHVTRTDPSTTNNLGPLDKTVTDVATVQNLYHMAQTLPAYATQESISQDCLNDLGVVYHLEFLQGSTDVQRMNLDPGNCKILYLSQTDLRQVSNAFLNLFKQAIQVNSLT
jgi:hypothetical protein